MPKLCLWKFSKNNRSECNVYRPMPRTMRGAIKTKLMIASFVFSALVLAVLPIGLVHFMGPASKAGSVAAVDFANANIESSAICADGNCAVGNMTCAASIAAQTTNVAALNVGNPINIVTGNKYQVEVDLSPLPGELALKFIRHYNSNGAADGVVGYNWRHTYHVKLERFDQSTISIRQADGRRVVFRLSSDDDIYHATMNTDGWVQFENRQYTWHWHSGRIVRFDVDGNMTHIEGASGKNIYLLYNRSGRLLQVTDPQDRSLAFSYYNNGRIKLVTDPAGRSIRYSYDKSGNLHTVTYPDKSTRRYHYEDTNFRHKLTGITNASGVRYATYAYDNKGRGILSTHADDVGKVTLKFGKNRTTVTNSRGVPTVYHTASKSGVPVVARIEGKGISACDLDNVAYQYNDRLQISKITDKSGFSVSYYYGNKGRLQSLYQKAPGHKRLLIKRYEYDDDNLFPSVIIRNSVAAGKQHRTVIHHNNDNKVMRIIETGYRPRGNGEHFAIYRTTNFDYKDGKLVAIDGPIPGPADTVRYHYDNDGLLTSIARPEGLTEQLQDYDAYGRPRRHVDPNGLVTEYRYNYQGQPIEIKRGALHYQVQYDPDGRPERVERPGGTYISAAYDNAGRLSRITDSRGNQIHWQRDTEDNVLQVSVLDSDDNVNLSQSFSYDDSDRLVKSLLPDGRAVNYLYGDNGQPKAVHNSLGQKIAYRYDAYRRLTHIVEAVETRNPVLTRIAYDISGNADKLSDAKGNSTEQLYDDFGNKIAVINPDQGMRLFRYDNAGRVIAKITESGALSYYHYDNAGRLVTVGENKNSSSLHYHYDGTKLVRAESDNQSTHLTYNDQGQLIRQSKTVLGRKFVHNYHYDEKTGKLLEKELPDGQVLAFSYDDTSGQLHAIKRKGLFAQSTLISDLSYRPFGPVDGFTHGNGMETSYQYDTSGKLNRLYVSDLQQMEYAYDKAGHITSIRRNGKQEYYQYDAAGRLTTAKLSEKEYAWAYDKLGNRLSQSFNGSAEKYQYSRVSNRLVSVENNSREFYLYDKVGNPLVIGQRKYIYNASGRPKAVYIDDKLTAMYLYNSQGQRIAKMVERDGKPHTTLYLYEAGRLSAEVDGNGKIQVQYLYMGKNAVAMLIGKKIYAIHSDHLGTPQVVTDENKNVVWQASYTPFGEASISQASITLNLRFPGHYYDAETQTHYNYFRDYDPATGRYLTADPLGIAGGINTYAYANADPIANTDVFGLFGEEMHYYMTYFLARMAGINLNEAMTIALAAQYIDDNSFETSPITGGINALESYHFTFNYDSGGFQGDATSDPDTRFHKGVVFERDAKTGVIGNKSIGRLSAQQANLRNAAVKEYYYPDKIEIDELGFETRTPVKDENGDPVPLKRCARAQLYGEFVHAFQDSYSHRFEGTLDSPKYSANEPIPLWNWRGGLGHALLGHEPDLTYNHIVIDENYANEDMLEGLQSVDTRKWTHNEARALKMQEELWKLFQIDFKVSEYNEKDEYIVGTGGATDAQGNVDPFTFTGKQITWETLAGNGRAEILTGAVDVNGFPLDSKGDPRDSDGRIVLGLDAFGSVITKPGPVVDLRDIQWQRVCDVDPKITCGGGDVLQEYNSTIVGSTGPDGEKITKQDKLEILNWAMLEHGLEEIPEYNDTLAKINRRQYLEGLVVTTDFSGVLLPVSYPLRDYK